MTTLFDSLPNEIIELILAVKSVNCHDLCCFGQCSKRFNDVAKDENLWKKKAKERWKNWSKKFDICESLSWLNVYCKRHQTEEFINNHLCILQEKSLFKTKLSEKDFSFIMVCLDRFGKDSYFYLNDVIQSIFQETDCSKDLTRKYFAKKTRISLTCLMCKNDVHTYLENPEQTEKLEQGATLIARWMCPLLSDISIEDINNKLDDIANMVRAKLELNDDQNITYKSDKTVQLNVINALKDVFYNQLKFLGNKENYYDLSNSYINKVLETKLGIPISLSVIFQSIAKRLGLCIEPVNCPGHFLVRWKYFDFSVNELKYRHIDCFNQGIFLGPMELPHALSPGPVPSPREVLKRMMLNIIHILQTEVERTQLHESIENLSHALNLFMILVPDHVEMTRLNARIKLYLSVQLDDVIKSLETLLQKQLTQHLEDKRLLELAKSRHCHLSLNEKQKAPEQKRRSDDKNALVLLTVGTIMHHRRFDYRCVVYGWDPVCKMTEDWIAQMGVDNLVNGRHQPFYNVLVSDGTERYASQESLGPEPRIEIITHPEIGRYFKEFTGDRYIPNEQLQQVYPEDSPMS